MTIPALPVPTDLAARLVGTPFLLLLDIDGTITPIAATPAAAVVSEEARRAIEELTRASGVHVAIVTGRSVEDARRLVGVDSAWYVGNHGLEVAAPGDEPAVPESVAQFRHSVQAAAARLAQLVRGVPGTILENKRWTLSVHYRLADHDVLPELGLARPEDRSRARAGRHRRKGSARASSPGSDQQGYRRDATWPRDSAR